MNKTKLVAVIFYLLAINVFGQENITIKGKVLDAETGQPLIYANVGISNHAYSTASDLDGNFGLLIPKEHLVDTLFISYVGYKTFTGRVSGLDLDNLVIRLEISTIQLKEVMINEQKYEYKLKIRRFENSLKLIKGNLYAANMEVTNEAYHHFLNQLQRSGQIELHNTYKPDFSKYQGSLLAFFKGYHRQYQNPKKGKFDRNLNEYPVVNITQEAAKAYCAWLTDLYNNSKGRRKFKQVIFRLPTRKEWQIAALGSKRFQSWEIEENEVLVGIPKYPGDEFAKKTKSIPVKGNDILYPWYKVYAYRNKVQNKNGCWLGNFKVPEDGTSCEIYRPDRDGFAITAPVGVFFPNGMGLYDVVGNVAEMIDEEGKACGGSWDHLPEESTITSVNTYSGSSGAVGFRIFMEVLEPK